MSYQKEGSMNLTEAFKTVANYAFGIGALAACVVLRLPPFSLPVPTEMVVIFGGALAAFAADVAFNKGRILVDPPLKEAVQVIATDLKNRFGSKAPHV